METIGGKGDVCRIGLTEWKSGQILIEVPEAG